MRVSQKYRDEREQETREGARTNHREWKARVKDRIAGSDVTCWLEGAWAAVYEYVAMCRGVAGFVGLRPDQQPVDRRLLSEDGSTTDISVAAADLVGILHHALGLDDSPNTHLAFEVALRGAHANIHAAFACDAQGDEDMINAAVVQLQLYLTSVIT